MNLFKLFDQEPEPNNKYQTSSATLPHGIATRLNLYWGRSWNVRILRNSTASSAMEEGLVNLLHSVRVVCVPGLLWRLLAIALTVRHPALIYH